MKIRRFLVLFLAAVLVISMNMTAFAKEEQHMDETNDIVEKYGISEDELVNLNNNLEKALYKANSVKNKNMRGESIEKIQVSENIYVMLTTKIDSQNMLSTTKGVPGKRYTVTASLELKNIVGATICTLNSVGVFESDFSICRPVDAYGTYSAIVWNVTNTSSSKGSPQYNTWVRNSFSGELNIGIDPVHMTLQSFEHSCTVHCDASGNAYAEWS